MSYTLEQKQTDSKQKVTLYLPPELHHNLKIRAAVEMEAMSVMAERALSFYLDHPEVVNHALGTTYQVHHCPECSHPFVIRDGEVHPLPSTAAVITDSEAELVPGSWSQDSHSSVDESKVEALVPC